MTDVASPPKPDPLPKYLRVTLLYLRDHEEVRGPADVARGLSLSVTEAEARIQELFERGLIARKE